MTDTSVGIGGTRATRRQALGLAGSVAGGALLAACGSDVPRVEWEPLKPAAELEKKSFDDPVLPYTGHEGSFVSGAASSRIGGSISASSDRVDRPVATNFVLPHLDAPLVLRSFQVALKGNGGEAGQPVGVGFAVTDQNGNTYGKPVTDVEKDASVDEIRLLAFVYRDLPTELFLLDANGNVYGNRVIVPFMTDLSQIGFFGWGADGEHVGSYQAQSLLSGTAGEDFLKVWNGEDARRNSDLSKQLVKEIAELAPFQTPDFAKPIEPIGR
jgi:hypothetical protein